jgi:hypothetical protein
MPGKGVAMDRLVQVDREQLPAQFRQEMEQTLARVMDAVNAAPDGRLIEASEGPVYDLMKDLERRVLEKALQMRVDSTESAFSPSGGRLGQAQTQQGPQRVVASDPAGPGEPEPHAVLRSGGHKRRADGSPDR